MDSNSAGALEHPEYTDDPLAVTHIRWCVASERAYDSNDHGDLIDMPYGIYEKRMQFILDRIGEKSEALYLNLKQPPFIIDGGSENQFASFSPRCDTITDAIYEPFYDDLTALEDEAVSAAAEAFPCPPSDQVVEPSSDLLPF